MRIACVSDLHEHLVEVPPCDLLVVAGDLTYAFGGSTDKRRWLEGAFAEWLEAVPADEIVVVAGNHDREIEQSGFPAGLRCHYLQDQPVELLGISIWGTPWQPWFHDWAFNAPRVGGESFLADQFSAIPVATDVVVCHGPPLGYGDRTPHGHVGSAALTETIDRVNPGLVVCGHIHSGAGRYARGEVSIINASIVDERYEPIRQPDVVELDPPAR